MRNIEAEIDAYLEQQANEHMKEYVEHIEEEDDCECSECQRERWEAYLDAKADAEYERWREEKYAMP